MSQGVVIVLKISMFSFFNEKLAITLINAGALKLKM